MTDVPIAVITSAEIEAAAKAISVVDDPDTAWDELVVYWQEGYRAEARAALTAAAQVRERAATQHAQEVLKLADHLSGMDSGSGEAKMLHGAAAELNRLQALVENVSAADARRYARDARAIDAIDDPTLMPVYGATEPDQGEDVLGMSAAQGTRE